MHQVNTFYLKKPLGENKYLFLQVKRSLFYIQQNILDMDFLISVVKESLCWPMIHLNTGVTYNFELSHLRWGTL